MRWNVWRVVGAVAAIGAVVLLAALSRVPYSASSSDRPILRLSWRAPGELVQECRRLSAEELEQLPVHMRREEVCEGRMIPYRLQVSLDGRLVLNSIVRPSGAREDRPLYVFHEIPVRPGEHQISVSWRADRDDPGTDREDRSMSLESTIRFDERDVVLITYDSDRRALETVYPSGAVSSHQPPERSGQALSLEQP